MSDRHHVAYSQTGKLAAIPPRRLCQSERYHATDAYCWQAGLPACTGQRAIVATAGSVTAKSSWQAEPLRLQTAQGGVSAAAALPFGFVFDESTGYPNSGFSESLRSLLTLMSLYRETFCYVL